MKNWVAWGALTVAAIVMAPTQSFAEKCPVSVGGGGFYATCSDPQIGPQGDKGDTGEKGDKGDTGVAGADGAKGDKGDTGEKGADGKDGVNGRDGQDFDMSRYEEGLATVAALNIPHVEKNFAVSGSAGFYQDKTAVGFGAAVRFDKTWQFGGSIAIGTGNGDVAGKAALTGQW